MIKSIGPMVTKTVYKFSITGSLYVGYFHNQSYDHALYVIHNKHFKQQWI